MRVDPARKTVRKYSLFIREICRGSLVFTELLCRNGVILFSRAVRCEHYFSCRDKKGGKNWESPVCTAEQNFVVTKPSPAKFQTPTGGKIRSKPVRNRLQLFVNSDVIIPLSGSYGFYFLFSYKSNKKFLNSGVSHVVRQMSLVV